MSRRCGHGSRLRPGSPDRIRTGVSGLKGLKVDSHHRRRQHLRRAEHKDRLATRSVPLFLKIDESNVGEFDLNCDAPPIGTIRDWAQYHRTPEELPSLVLPEATATVRGPYPAPDLPLYAG